jgi:hypothetical protein
MRAAGVEQNDIVGVAGILVGEVECVPDLGVAQAAMPLCRELVEDTSELFAFEPLGGRIK